MEGDSASLRCLFAFWGMMSSINLLKQLFKQLRFLKPSVPVLGERGMVRNLLIETETGEPAPCQVHA